MRLFVAIELSDTLRHAMTRAQRSLSSFDRVVRWVGPDQMHLTLKFLGEVADDRVGEIAAALESAASSATGFTFRAGGAGCFPPRGKARVVWIALEEETGALMACQRAVEDAWSGIGFEPEARPFAPHLTLGRVKEDSTEGQLRRAVEGLSAANVTQVVGSLALVSSELTPRGARYTRLGEWRLGDHVSG
jgi:2'-5' RNA ligase